MRVRFVVFLIILFPFLTHAQNKQEQKLFQYYEKGDFVKLEKKAAKLVKKKKDNNYGNYFLSIIQLHKCKNSTSDSKRKRYVSNSIRYINKVDSNVITQYTQIWDSLYQIILLNAKDSTLNQALNKKYRFWLAQYFDEHLAPFQYTRNSNLSHKLVDSTHFYDAIRSTMLKNAQQLKGVRYKYAGSTPQNGFDCSGFTQYVYKSVGINIPHNANMQSNLTSDIVELNNLKPGDLIFFGSTKGNSHRAIHAGIIFDKQGDQLTVIHCVSGGVSIEGVNSSWDRYWIDRVLFGISLDSLVKND